MQSYIFGYLFLIKKYLYFIIVYAYFNRAIFYSPFVSLRSNISSHIIFGIKYSQFSNKNFLHHRRQGLIGKYLVFQLNNSSSYLLSAIQYINAAILLRSFY